MKNALKHFREHISAEFTVVGSLVLTTVGGFTLDVHDIDIEVDKSNADLIMKLKVLEAASPRFVSNYDSTVRVDFEYRGFRFNAFLVENCNREVVWSDGIKYATVLTVLGFKKSYARVKDFKSINSIIQEILK